jgi:tetratricopeptide (TPR) repeat protein
LANSRQLALLLVLASCKGIQAVRVDPPRPVATISAPEQVRADGLKLYAAQPRSLTRVKRAAQELEEVAGTLRDDYDAQWQAAQALAFLAEHETKPAARKEAAKRGMAIAKHGRQLNPGRVECHYWYAINVGMFADVERSYGLSAVGEIEAALKRAIEIDERYDYAGPLRTLGVLLVRTPGPPVSIGSARKGLRLLQRATELFPDYPENYLYLAEALRDNRRFTEAKAALAKVIESKPWPDRQLESNQWKADAQKLRQKLPKDGARAG